MNLDWKSGLSSVLAQEEGTIWVILDTQGPMLTHGLKRSNWNKGCEGSDGVDGTQGFEV